MKESGQSLVEVLVALTIATLVVVTLIIVVLAGLKNSQFAQNQSRATKYAQEAMEKIKTIRDRNGTVQLNDQGLWGTKCATQCYSTDGICHFSDLWSCDLSSSFTPCTSSPQQPEDLHGCYFDLELTGNDPKLVELPGTADNSSPVVNLEDGLTREIYFEDDASFNKEKKVTVKVKWTDSSGPHESNLETVFTGCALNSQWCGGSQACCSRDCIPGGVCR